MASLRGRVSIALMAFSGLRPQSLGNYDGSDGIRLGDFPEAEIHPGGNSKRCLPCSLYVKTWARLDTNTSTFVPQQTITYIQEYLEDRVKQGERLSKDSLLLGFDPRGVKKNRFLRTNLVTRDVREVHKRNRPCILLFGISVFC
jgi:hypothetical protein